MGLAFRSIQIIGIVAVACIVVSCGPQAREAELPVTPEQAAVTLATQTLAAANPTFERKYILPDGPATRVGSDFDVTLGYWAPSDSALRRFTCHSVGQVTKCVPLVSAVDARESTGSLPTIGTSPGRSASPPTYVGPRGGVYHYSSSGRKVYERHRK